MGEVMPLIALRGLTVFPNLVLHFDLGREKSIIALERAMIMNQTIFLVSQKDAEIELPSASDIYNVGTVAKVKQMLKLPDGNIRVLVDGQYRAKLDSMISDSPYFLASVSELPDTPAEMTADVQALMRTALTLFEEYQILTPKNNAQDKKTGLDDIDDPGRIADVIASAINIKTSDAQKILATTDPVKRLGKVVKLLTRETEILKLENKISSKVKTQMSKSQREYYLREQMRAIQEELGGGESSEDEAAEWRKNLKKLKLDPAVTKKIEKEIDQFTKMPGNSPEASVIRSYVEAVLDLPWNKADKTEESIVKAQQVLDEDHYGMAKVKDRILEYLAVQTLSGSNNKAPILCLVGPPGVGKTSIARSVARATGRKFVHMSLGGVRDEAEIRGHRRTYIGAIPGRIMTLLRECGSNNPVFLFDEVDKIGADFRGDPASALLEVLDPEQNNAFRDHYLDIPFDLSNVLFIATANVPDTIPGPLYDRMEVINMSGYLTEEKFNIAKRHLIPKQLPRNGLTKKHIQFTDSSLYSIIHHYAREAGVRTLEKAIGECMRKVALAFAEKPDMKKVTISSRNLSDYLGKPRFEEDPMLRCTCPGVAMGLAWTAQGGTTLHIESLRLAGGNGVKLTGHLGDVMKESTQIACSFIQSNSDHYGIDKNFFKDSTLHIHVPAGAIPKDGPSAGITIASSLLSLALNRPCPQNWAMTGELTLTGRVLPIGGVKEKTLAAIRANATDIILPKDNEKDFSELPESMRTQINPHYVDEFHEVSRLLLNA
jgi:ATP-dependent Lon protease